MKISEQQALYRIASYCSKAERSEGDVRKKLAAWELSEEAIRNILNRLIKEKYLDEERFCRSFVNDKIHFNKWGKNKIVFELRKKGISEKIYKPILDEWAEDEIQGKLLHILHIKAKTVKAENDYEKKTKLIRFALGRGFSMDMAVKSVNQIIGGDYEEAGQ